MLSIDGILIGTQSTSSVTGIVGGTSNLELASRPDFEPRSDLELNAIVDEVRIYNRALNAEEIAAIGKSSQIKKPNLTYYKPDGWDYPIVASSVSGTHSVNRLTANQTTYIDWAIINEGEMDIPFGQTFYTDLYIDGIKITVWHTDELQVTYWTFVEDWVSTVTFTPGKHTIKIVTDATGVIDESNESDNEYQIEFEWVGSGEIRVISPNGGENWLVGSTQNIQWTSTNAGSNVKIEISRDGGSSWTTIVNSTPNDGSHSWAVASPVANNAKVRITSTSNSFISDISNSNFAISAPPPRVTIVSPNGGENWPIGSTQTIQWTSSGNIGSVRIQISRDGGVNWSNIVSTTPNDGSHNWTVTSPQSNNAKIRIRSTSNSSISDISDGSFVISQLQADLVALRAYLGYEVSDGVFQEVEDYDNIDPTNLLMLLDYTNNGNVDANNWRIEVWLDGILEGFANDFSIAAGATETAQMPLENTTPGEHYFEWRLDTNNQIAEKDETAMNNRKGFSFVLPSSEPEIIIPEPGPITIRQAAINQSRNVAYFRLKWAYPEIIFDESEYIFDALTLQATITTPNSDAK